MMAPFQTNTKGGKKSPKACVAPPLSRKGPRLVTGDIPNTPRLGEVSGKAEPQRCACREVKAPPIPGLKWNSPDFSLDREVPRRPAPSADVSQAQAWTLTPRSGDEFPAPTTLLEALWGAAEHHDWWLAADA